MEVAFDVPAESVYGKIYAYREVLFLGLSQDDSCGTGCEQPHQPPVCPYDVLEFMRERECDMLPGGVWQFRVRIGDPHVRRLFSAWGTESAFTGMRGVSEHVAVRTDIAVESEEGSAAGKKFDHVGNYGKPNEMAFLDKQSPPIAIGEENIFDFNRAA